MAYSDFHVDVFSFPILWLIMVLIIDLSLYFTHFVARAPDMLKLCARHIFFSLSRANRETQICLIRVCSVCQPFLGTKLLNLSKLADGIVQHD